MLKKQINVLQWVPPSYEDVKKNVVSLGGTNVVSSMLKKHRNTVTRWCTGKQNIDYANWYLLCIKLDEKVKDFNNEL